MAAFEFNNINEINMDATAAGLLSPNDNFNLFGESIHTEANADPNFAFHLGGTGHNPIDETSQLPNWAGVDSTAPVGFNGVDQTIDFDFEQEWWTDPLKINGSDPNVGFASTQEVAPDNLAAPVNNNDSDPLCGLGPIIAYNESVRQAEQAAAPIDPAIVNTLVEQNNPAPITEAPKPSPETDATQAAAQSDKSSQPIPSLSSQTSLPSHHTTNEIPPQPEIQAQVAAPISQPALAPQPAPIAQPAVAAAPGPLQAPVTVPQRKKPGRKQIPDGLPGDTAKKEAQRKAQRKSRFGKEMAKAAAAALADGPSVEQIDQEIQDIQMADVSQPTVAQTQPAAAEQDLGTASHSNTNSQLSYGLHYQANGDLHMVMPQGHQAHLMAQQYSTLYQMPALPYNAAAQYYPPLQPYVPTPSYNQYQFNYPRTPYNHPPTFYPAQSSKPAQPYYAAPSSNQAPAYNTATQYNPQMQFMTASQPMPAMSFNQSNYLTM